MEKEKSVRKKSTEKNAGPLLPSAPSAAVLPQPPPDPLPSVPTRTDLPEAFRRIIGYKEREATFFRQLRETIQMESANHRADLSAAARAAEMAAGACRKITPPIMIVDEFGTADALTEECDNYVLPLVKRTGPSISAALVTEGAIDQLDRLHGILEQLLHMQEQKYKMRRNTRDVEMLSGLQRLQKQVISFVLYKLQKYIYCSYVLNLSTDERS